MWQGRLFNVVRAYKPQVARGECRTDIYVALTNDINSESAHIKISVKQSNAEFLVNKMTPDNAQEILGEHWEQILIDSIAPIKTAFLGKTILFHNQDINLTMGWKLEIANKPRTLSSPLALSNQEIKDFIYRGTQQAPLKKHAYVNGCTIENSGIADYLLEGVVEDFQTADDAIQGLIYLTDPDYTPPTPHLIFTANNYRLLRNSTDGNRHIAVGIKWQYAGHNKLRAEFLFHSPFAYRSNDLKVFADAALQSIGISPPYDAHTNVQNIEIERCTPILMLD